MIITFALHAANQLVNQLLKSDPVSQERINSSLAGKTFRVVLNHPNLSLDIDFMAPGKIGIEPTAYKDGEAELYGPFDQPRFKDDADWALFSADCVLHVDTLSDAFKLLLAPAANAPIQGDMRVLQHIKTLLGGLDLSVGERLSKWLGSSIGGQIDEFLKKLKSGGARSAQAADFYAKEHLTEDTELLVKRQDFEQMKRELRELKLGIERTQAQLKAKQDQISAEDP